MYVECDKQTSIEAQIGGVSELINQCRLGSNTLLVHSLGLAYQGKDIVFGFIIE
jgi:hypothetical protein